MCFPVLFPLFKGPGRTHALFKGPGRALPALQGPGPGPNGPILALMDLKNQKEVYNWRSIQ